MPRKRPDAPAEAAGSTSRLPLGRRRCQMRKRPANQPKDGVLTLDAVFGARSKPSTERVGTSGRVLPPSGSRAPLESDKASSASCRRDQAPCAQADACSEAIHYSHESDAGIMAKKESTVTRSDQGAEYSYRQASQPPSGACTGFEAQCHLCDRPVSGLRGAAVLKCGNAPIRPHDDTAVPCPPVVCQSCDAAWHSNRVISSGSSPMVQESLAYALPNSANTENKKVLGSVSQGKRNPSADWGACVAVDAGHPQAMDQLYGASDGSRDAASVSSDMQDAVAATAPPLLFRMYAASASSSSSSSSSTADYSIHEMFRETPKRTRCGEAHCVSNEEGHVSQRMRLARDPAREITSMSGKASSSITHDAGCRLPRQRNQKRQPRHPGHSSGTTSQDRKSYCPDTRHPEGSCDRHHAADPWQRLTEERGMLATCTRMDLVPHRHWSRCRDTDVRSSLTSETDTDQHRERDNGECRSKARSNEQRLETTPLTEANASSESVTVRATRFAVTQMSPSSASPVSVGAGTLDRSGQGSGDSSCPAGAVFARPIELVFRTAHVHALRFHFSAGKRCPTCRLGGRICGHTCLSGAGVCSPEAHACLICDLGDLAQRGHDQADDQAYLSMLVRSLGNAWLCRQALQAFSLSDAIERHWSGSAQHAPWRPVCTRPACMSCSVWRPVSIQSPLGAFLCLLISWASALRPSVQMAADLILEPYWQMLAHSLDTERWSDASLLLLVEDVLALSLDRPPMIALWRYRFIERIVTALERVSSESAFQAWCLGLLDAAFLQPSLPPRWQAAAIGLIRALPPKGRCRRFQQCLCVCLVERGAGVASEVWSSNVSSCHEKEITLGTENPLSSISLIGRAAQWLVSNTCNVDQHGMDSMDLDTLDWMIQCLRVLLLDWGVSTNAATVPSSIGLAQKQHLLAVIAHWMRVTRSVAEPRSYRLRTQLHLLRRQLCERSLECSFDAVVS
jgi:hypothetical protein